MFCMFPDSKSEWKKMGNRSEFHLERNYYLQNWYFKWNDFWKNIHTFIPLYFHETFVWHCDIMIEKKHLVKTLVYRLGLAKQDLWGLGAESLCIVGSCPFAKNDPPMHGGSTYYYRASLVWPYNLLWFWLLHTIRLREVAVIISEITMPQCEFCPPKYNIDIRMFLQKWYLQTAKFSVQGFFTHIE